MVTYKVNLLVVDPIAECSAYIMWCAETTPFLVVHEVVIVKGPSLPEITTLSWSRLPTSSWPQQCIVMWYDETFQFIVHDCCGPSLPEITTLSWSRLPTSSWPQGHVSIYSTRLLWSIITRDNNPFLSRLPTSSWPQGHVSIYSTRLLWSIITRDNNPFLSLLPTSSWPRGIVKAFSLEANLPTDITPKMKESSPQRQTTNLLS